MSDYILARLKGIYQVIAGGSPLPRRGALEIKGTGCRVEDNGIDRTVLTIPSGVTADATGGARTTGAQGPLLVAALAIPVNTAGRVQVDIYGQSAVDATVGYAVTYHITVQRSGVATVVIVGAVVVSSDISAPLTGCSVAAGGSGAEFQTRITGVAGQTVDWNARIRVLAGAF